MPYIDKLLQYKNNYFIETGTYKGETIDIIYKENIYNYIYSIELSEIFYNNCVEKFKNHNNVNIIHGNSKYDLINIIKNINEPITFWLDGHWSGVENVGCDIDDKCPILFELDQIKNHSINTHTIIVDDMRLMDLNHFNVSKDQIVNKILTINPNYNIKYYNDECADNDILVAYI